ncbi:pirin family protein [Lujinxingia vulgaris]|uniref:Pirin family protein n=1 Tax=Lujinxingia vulgaris TaxID=2600176 RepID=A0A5C6X8S0_9DELT|nr:pirin family protein [Lujinxingia vulgaris]TXD36722.1 pirin family protein [Lujinxingia vulgaris]
MSETKKDAIRAIVPLTSTPWPTLDPFLFCVHHNDHYPVANEKMGPDASLAGRNIGNDFSGKDGWSMYHGDTVPGFPRHPHAGFETVTIARKGFIDHSDSMGASARFGQGDVQWMTAGKGVVHSEAFPLLDRENPNTTELFQIWLNLPREDKKKDAYFTMFWNETIPRHLIKEGDATVGEVAVIAGALHGLDAPTPPPSSWAARDESNIAIWTIKLQPGASFTLPAANDETGRVLYFFEGDALTLEDVVMEPRHGAQVEGDAEVTLQNTGSTLAEVLVLQGRPIGEPVVQHGPFVGNYQGDIRQIMIDYQNTGFGGWPFDADAPVHPRDKGRFAIHADGREETPANPENAA